MIIIKGKYNSAKVFTDNLDENAAEQIKMLCSQEFVRGSKIRVMPDVHAGAGCTIGTTMTILDKVVPNLVGVDIGCGMEVILIEQNKIDPEKLDRIIYENIPGGFKIRKKPHEYNSRINLKKLNCASEVNLERASKSIGTLGGGNHFIEVDRDDEGGLYIVVHSGSRHLGNEVAKLYQELAIRLLGIKKDGNDTGDKEGIPRSLAYLTGKYFDQYMDDMKLVQKFADLNRKAIIDILKEKMGLYIEEQFTTIHNYIDTLSMILRKGAVSALKGEKLLLPVNMRDGSFICAGKGNKDWNYSAPHGAGRKLSRTLAKKTLTLEQFKNTMKGIYTTSVNKGTLDECALAYKPMKEILDNIGGTVEILKRIMPVYNFKAAE